MLNDPDSDITKLPEVIRAFAKEQGDFSPENWRSRWRQWADFGLLKLGAPAAFGGRPVSTLNLIEALEALGYGCTDNGFTMGMCSQIWTVQEPLKVFGSEQQQARYLPDLVQGKSIGAYALTEKDSGSDAMRLTTTAERREGGYVLNGAKTLIGMAPVCDVALVFASTAPERGSWGLSAFLVEKGDTGFTPTTSQSKIGLTTLPMGEIVFDNCFLPEDRRLGPEGAGASIFQATMDWERSFILAPHVGAMERQLGDCTKFAHDRKVFEQKIVDFQSISNRLADMRLRLETSKLMLRKAAQIRDDGGSDMQHAAMTNLHISEAFLASSLDAFRIFGGLGYLSSMNVGSTLTDALGGVIYSGTSDVQRQVIAKLIRPRG